MPATQMAPTTEREAVNEMLSAIGESPVSSLSSDNLFADAEAAKNLLRSVSRRIQKTGCHFNTERSFKITPNTDGEIVLPRNTLSADEIVPQTNIARDLVVRGHRLYDIHANTYDVGEAVKLDLILMLDFEEAPESFRDYVTVKAARIFTDRYLGERDTHAFNEADEKEAYAAFRKEQVRTKDRNSLNNIHSQRILNRRTLLTRCR